MATNIKIILDDRRPKKEGTFPLVLRILRDRKSISIPLGYCINKGDWDISSSTIKKSCKLFSNITHINNFLQKKRSEAFDMIAFLEDTKQIDGLSIKDIKERIINQNKVNSFNNYTEKIINEFLSIGKFGNAKAYRNMYSVVKRFTGDKEIVFNEINYEFLKKFENHYFGLGNSTNALSFILRTLRAVYNRAIKEGLVKREMYPFDKYQIKNTKTKKRALRKGGIQEIANYNFPENSKIWHAKNYFLFSFYMMGMSFSDMAYLKLKNIIAGRIQFERQKTENDYSTKINEKANEILKFYTEGKKSDDYIFPIIERKANPGEAYKDVRNRLKVYNKQLKLIASTVGIEVNLTSYFSRHTWATEAKRLNIPIEIIQEALGHTDLSTTKIYLERFDNDVLDNANDLITG